MVEDPLLCDFCAKTQHEVFLLIHGPIVYICDECVDLCARVVALERARRARDRGEAEYESWFASEADAPDG